MDNKYLSWEEIKSIYPNGWVSIIEPETIEGEGLKRGIVIAYNQDNKKLCKKTKKLIQNGLQFKRMTFVYTGEIPYIVGLSKLEIHNVQN